MVPLLLCCLSNKKANATVTTADSKALLPLLQLLL
jgi:hypothetical protein